MVIGKRDERSRHTIDVNHFTEPVDYDDGLLVTESGHGTIVASLLRDTVVAHHRTDKGMTPSRDSYCGSREGRVND